jgi:putative copper resistance protein D
VAASSPLLGDLLGDPVHQLSILLSIASDLAYAVILGLLLARRWLTASLTHLERPSQLTLRNLLLTALAVFTLAHIARPWFLAASMSGSNAFRENLALVPSILTATHQGKLWFLNTLAIALLLVSLLIRRTKASTVLAVVSVLLIACLKSSSSHAGDEGDFTLLESLQSLHILATAVWSGAILVSGLLVLPRLRNLAPETVWHFATQLSRTATVAVAAVFATGLYTSDRELNVPLAALWHTLVPSLWGKVLLAKILVVLLALALGAGNRLLCLARSATAARVTLLSRLLLAEAWTMLLVLALSGLLGNTSPPMSGSL